jgi:hypothetical protein
MSITVSNPKSYTTETLNPKPYNVADLLTDSYARGGVVSILALNGLFHLIQVNP